MLFVHVECFDEDIYYVYLLIEIIKCVFLCISDSYFAYMQGTKIFSKSVIYLLMHLTLPFAEKMLNLLK